MAQLKQGTTVGGKKVVTVDQIQGMQTMFSAMEVMLGAEDLGLEQDKPTIEQWKQPADDEGYDEGAKVYFEDQLWISVHLGKNTWSPAEYGWELETEV